MTFSRGGMRHRLQRRTVLKGMLGGSVASVALPALEAMFNGNGTALADGTAIPRRLVVWFWGNGNEPERWTPVGTGRDWTPSYALEPLAAIKHRVSVITGMTLPIQNKTNPHVEGAVGMMSGTNPVVHPSFAGKGVWDYMTYRAETLDQVVARTLGATTPFRTLELGATPPHPSAGPGNAVGFISHRGPYAPNPYSDDPVATFNRLFGADSPITRDASDPWLSARASVLDAVMQDGAELRLRLGRNDQQRLDQHLESVRSLERRLKTPAQPRASCRRPGAPDGTPAGDTVNARVMGELLAMALACDLTRVATFTFSSPASHVRYDNVAGPLICNGSNEPSFHEFQHCVAFTELVRAVLRYFIERFADFVRTLDGVAEGAGTLLDHACVWGTSEVANGWSHKHDNMPLLIAGSAGGRLATGVHLPIGGDASARLATRVPLTIMRALDVPRRMWGEEQFATASPIEELLS